ncbi:hypothetical protein GPECTOR_27g705 [Gonium pectorale]|uniref:Uncharacterized protein n=1 Tax=Gonium pectorale TaxID=33097 RepID=A0A150GFC9_GONPE|nr:hypothetical protein GPECTOR_27g705 [Gonium pectorale]|eukprot:KXZ48534.1 hypothetical protein GPECTOR_27g705 [Gonium pectorale]
MIGTSYETAFAGAAAQEEDTRGLPTYAQFKKYATFKPDISDFGVDLKQLNRLLAECDYFVAVGGMGLGDLNILYGQEAKRASGIPFDGVLRMCRLIRPRLEKVRAALTPPEIDEEALFEGGTVRYRTPGVAGGAAAASWNTAMLRRSASFSRTVHARNLRGISAGGAGADASSAAALRNTFRANSAYDEAIEKFEQARDLAERLARGTMDLTARRNAAACLNNKGVCYSLLGQRADAVAAFRSAHHQLRPSEGLPDSPEALVAARNLSKALKQAFALNTAKLRPTSAPVYASSTSKSNAAVAYSRPGLYSTVGNTNIPKEDKLTAFLRSAITMRSPAPVTSVPAWRTKVTADDIILRKKEKELAAKAKARLAARAGDDAKGGKKKAAPKGPPPFEGMVGYPYASYGVANVKFGAKKKAVRKKAA